MYICIYIYIHIYTYVYIYNIKFLHVSLVYKLHGVMRGITSSTFIHKAMWDQLSNIITFTNLLPIFIFANISWCDFVWSYENSDKEPPKNMYCRRCSYAIHGVGGIAQRKQLKKFYAQFRQDRKHNERILEPRWWHNWNMISKWYKHELWTISTCH